ncbi:MAG: thioredoxin domain-containing protein [Candidatus Omnitrophica bacterium]|nr:thioredoxin domain-containing protein [Candidatus Omnitrophota bacterium]
MDNASLFQTVLFLPLVVLGTAGAAGAHSNRLIHEKSPYLLQHAHNPVDWYPWGEEAFEKARKENKPILLSIGYSTCHWCHVMEEESFENPETAALMNARFVSIKVDREERPDIDSVYMNYVTATTGSGGWPMTVFLTPDRKPFYGGTYFPPEDRYGMPGFPSLLRSLAEAWQTRRDEILKSADSAVKFLSEAKAAPPGALSQEIFFSAFERYQSAFDAERGGFGPAPKFPRPHALSMLLGYWDRTGNTRALAMAEKTLTEMDEGGIHDQLGGGFHRYSTDARWRVPHFEKMLYDQALLARASLEAYQATHKARYARVARDILDYVLRELTDRAGGFFSAQDADSPDPADPSKKIEGAYYVWKKEEIEKILSEEEAKEFFSRYGVDEVLFVAHPQAPPSPEPLLGKLWDARNKRPAPHLDDKILTDWNALMISAFCLGADVLDEPRYREAAAKAGEFIWDHLRDKKGTLLHRWRDGEAAIGATLNDYAFLIQGAIDLYETTFDEKWLSRALSLTDEMLARFWDDARGGFFLTGKDAKDLFLRPTEIYDGAVPSGNAVATLDLLRLARFTGREAFQKYAERTFGAFSREITAEPTAYPQMLVAFDFAVGPSSEIVIAAGEKDPFLKEVLKEIHLRFLPNKITILHREGPAGEAMEKISPFIRTQTALNGRPAVYVCQNQVCQLPVTETAELRKLLGKKSHVA